MDKLEKGIDVFHNALGLNASNFSGAIDIIVVPQSNTTTINNNSDREKLVSSGDLKLENTPLESLPLKSTPFHVRFGKFQIAKATDKIVSIYVNDEIVPEVKMKLGNNGEAYFLEETQMAEATDSLITSPLVSPPPLSPKVQRATVGKQSVSEEQFEVSVLTEKLQDLIEKKGKKDSPPEKEPPTSSFENNPVPNDPKSEKLFNIGIQKTSPQQVPHSDTKGLQPTSLHESFEDHLSVSTSPMTPPFVPASSPHEPSDLYKHQTLAEPQVEHKSDAEFQKTSSSEEQPWDQKPTSVPVNDQKKNQTWLDWTWGRLPKTQKNPPTEKQLEPSEEIKNLQRDIDQQLQQNPPLQNQGYLSKMGSLFRIFKGRNQAPVESNVKETNVKEPALKETNLKETNLKETNLKETNLKETNLKETNLKENEILKKEELKNSDQRKSITDEEEPIFEIDKEDTPLIQKQDEIPPFEEFNESTIPKFEISRCGHILRPQNWKDFTDDQRQTIFNENKLEYSEISEIPDLIFDSNILFRINGTIYPWSIAGPWMISLLVFKRPLRKDTLITLEQKYDLEKNKVVSQKRGWKEWLWRKKEAPPLVPEKETVLAASSRSELSSVGQTFMIKSLRPTTSQLQKFKLKWGVNQIRFEISNGATKREIRSRIFVWKPYSRIIISDIDGTITRSDVFGQIMPMVGRDWSHSGVAQLYSNIVKNNYHVLYLTSRAIGQADLTRGYISNLKQNQAALPEGPVIMSPNRLITAFNQEVIRRAPEEFKISALRDIKHLFPNDSSPFYAGFGNRPTDAIAYRAVDVPFGKIFTINYQGDISVVNYTFKKTYSTINELIEETFPLYNANSPYGNYHREEWNSWQYWRAPTKTLEELN